MQSLCIIIANWFFLLHCNCTCNQASVSHFLLMISLCNSSITLKPEERGINCMWNEKPPVKYWFFAINCMVHEAQGIDSGVKLGCDFFFYFVENITLTFLHWLLITYEQNCSHRFFPAQDLVRKGVKGCRIWCFDKAE